MRLIDADELMEHVWRDKLDCRGLIAEMVNKAPTVKEIPTNIPISIFERLISQEPCSNCCDGNQIEKAKLCQKSYLAGMEHKQEACEDAISRQAVLDILKEKWNMFSDANDAIQESIDTIEALQPVTPQPKMGYWIDDEDGFGTRCSKCKKWYSHSIITKHEVLYCSSCGAKMQEVKDYG